MSMPIAAVPDRVVAHARDARAVVADDAELSYGELADLASGLGSSLADFGVSRGSLVAICLPRSAALVVACLAVLRAGAVYVAIDPGQPIERARSLALRSNAPLLLTEANGFDTDSVEACGPLDIRIVRLGSDIASLNVDPENPPAYVKYTSGSTGEPKGVLVGHAGLANLVDWHGSTFGVLPGTRCSQIAGPGFDAAAWEIWGCLANGGTLVVAPESVKTDPAQLRDWLVAQTIEVAFVPTALANLVLALEWPDGVDLRVLLTGGDRLGRRPRASLPFTVVNNYGVTEATVVSTSTTVLPGETIPTIGAAIDGVALRVCDSAMLEVATGESGELFVGGPCVALGYLGAPELTAAAFVTLPDGTGPWYRTGDVVRRRFDDEFEYIARVDDQVQVRGHRVEPGEVAAALTRIPGVAAAVVLGVGELPAEPTLVAFWQAEETSTLVPGSLRALLATKLPPHMMPQTFVQMDELPQNVNGKVDRAALRALLPVADVTSTPVTADDQAEDLDVETAVARIVAGVLKIPAIAADDNFLLMGGHSLLGAQVVARLASRFDVEISLRDLFDNPTPRGMAQLVTDELVAQVLALDETTVAELLAGSGL